MPANAAADLLLTLPSSGAGMTPQQIKQFLIDRSREKIASLLPVVDVALPDEQRTVVSREQQARLILGPCAQAAMVCSGKQCPIAFQCRLVKLGKAPEGERCPFEVNYIAERFASWLRDVDKDLDSLTEPERLTISNLVELDVEELRIRTILSHYERAKLTAQVVRDVDVETGQPLCWEDIIDPLATRLNEIATARRMLLKDFELTPEMQTRRKKVLGIHAEDDLASRQTRITDQVRKALEGSGS